MEEPKPEAKKSGYIICRVCGYIDTADKIDQVCPACGYPKTVWMPEKAEYTNLLSGGTDEIVTMDMPGWGFLWMKKKGQLL